MGDIGLSLIHILLVQIFGKQLILLFTPASPEVLAEGIVYLRICCGVNSLVYAAMYTFDSFAIGTGAATIALFLSLIHILTARCFSPSVPYIP